MNLRTTPAIQFCRNHAPSLVVIAIVLTGLLACGISARIKGSPFQLMYMMSGLNLDFRDFYEGATQFVQGKSLYAIIRFVTPPLPAVLLAPLTIFRFETAGRIFLVLNALALLLGLVLARRQLHTTTIKEGYSEFALLFCAALLAYPTQFLLHRGNIDGLVFLSVMVSIYIFSKRTILSGLLLAVAISLKVYPCLLLVSGVVERRWRWLAASIISLVVLASLTYEETGSYVSERLFKRSQMFFSGDNLSFTSTFFHARRAILSILAIPAPYSNEFLINRDAGTFTLLGLIVAVVVLHSRLYRRASSSLRFMPFVYLPLMVGYPAHVYPYSQVLNLAQLALLQELWRNSESIREKMSVLLMSVALGCSFIHMYSLVTHLNSMWFFAIPSTANLIYVVLLISHLSQEKTRNTETAAV